VTVYLVGAGPGGPELITRRAAEVLATASVVVVDGLVDQRVLELSSPNARIVDVSKRAWGRGPSWNQSSINALLVALGRNRREVVRLKGGDPFVFGRGGEELAALRAAGVEVEVVPGVSSAIGLPALAGVAVTQRGVSASVTIVSGHDVEALRADALVALGGTIVVVMGVENRSQIADRLTAAGLRRGTPVLVIEAGATERERRRRVELGSLGRTEVSSPATIVIGEVVAQADGDLSLAAPSAQVAASATGASPSSATVSTRRSLSAR
jgi:uroporphyrin-III C-methyltransferase